MTLVKIEFKDTKKGVYGIKKRELQKVGRAAIGEACAEWWTQFLPLHFTPAGGRKYKYRPRQGNPGSGRPFSGSYAESKIKRSFKRGVGRPIGENKPFVFTGKSRRSALAGKKIRTRAPSYKEYFGAVSINAPVINFVPDGNDELTRITPDETAVLEQTFGDEYEKQLNNRGRTAR